MGSRYNRLIEWTVKGYKLHGASYIYQLIEFQAFLTICSLCKVTICDFSYLACWFRFLLLQFFDFAYILLLSEVSHLQIAVSEFA